MARGPVAVRLDAPAPGAEGRPPLVFLHEGLGSLELWRDFPAAVRRACGGPAALVWSRHGYGRSAAVAPPWPLTYMHDEALVALPELLGRLGLSSPVLIGHSDGASIALVHAGAGHAVSGLVLLAPHVFVEDRSIEGIEAARRAYETADLRARLARYHDNVDATFFGWNGAWLSPAFRNWNIEAYLPGVTCPVLLVQGDVDEYATLAQLDAIAAGVRGPAERLVLPGGRHAPHLDHPTETLAAVARFVRALGPPATER